MVGLTVISCSKDDDAGRTTDPLIGTWTVEGEGFSVTAVFNEDGTFTRTEYYQGDTQNPDISLGTWRNNGSDFSSTIQIYTFTTVNSEGNGEDYIETPEITFTDDFNSWQPNEDYCDNVCETWFRQ